MKNEKETTTNLQEEQLFEHLPEPDLVVFSGICADEFIRMTKQQKQQKKRRREADEIVEDENE